MPTLTFTVPELEEKLRRKEVRQTFRDEAYIKRENLFECLKDNSPVQIFLRSEHIGDVNINSIERITARDLNDEDVRIEGFPSFEEMVKIMKRKGIYPTEEKKEKMFRIRFHWI